MPDAYSVLQARTPWLMSIEGVTGTGVGNGVIQVYCTSERCANNIPRMLDGVPVVTIVTRQPVALY